KEGKKPDIGNVRFHKTWLIVLACLIQTITRVMGSKGIRFVVEYSLVIQGIVFILLFICLWFNRRYIGLWVTGVGASLNALVMVLNGGRMPVSLEIMKNAGLMEAANILSTGADSRHVVMSGSTRLGFLADIIYLPGFLGMGMPVVSIGDLIIALGIFILTLELCTCSMKLCKEH
ncbi:MAG: DUF5317 domain-containing protein, partial [Bacillota bacterium]